MEPSYWPRHRLRAQGRPEGRFRQIAYSNTTSNLSQSQNPSNPGQAPARAQVPTRSDAELKQAEEISGHKAQRLLNYLSDAAREKERSFLSPARTPDFAVVKRLDEEISGIAQSLQLEVRNRRGPVTADLKDPIQSFAPPLAEPIVMQGALVQSAFTPPAQPRVDTALLLNEWFNAPSTSEESPDIDDSLSISMFGTHGDASQEAIFGEPETFLLSLENVLEEHEETKTARVEPPRIEPINSIKTRAAKQAGGRHQLAARLSSKQPSFELESGSERIEVFANGSEVVKDMLGRVKEVRSTNGIFIAFTYNIEGHLISFARFDRAGTMHSYGEKDRHGVVVRDANGRVMAQGEQMTVDPSGCLSIRKSDGQFWSVDAVRGIHRERRLLQSESGRLYGLTALFTADGFRMMTRFHPETSLSTPVGVALGASTEPLLHFGGIFRFYGRDGSLIQFDSESALKKECPTHVWPAKTLLVEVPFRGKGQARSAWDAVRDYMSIYMCAV